MLKASQDAYYRWGIGSFINNTTTLLHTGKENGLVDFCMLKLISVNVGSYWQTAEMKKEKSAITGGKQVNAKQSGLISTFCERNIG